jgi:hypothetical protein
MRWIEAVFQRLLAWVKRRRRGVVVAIGGVEVRSKV